MEATDKLYDAKESVLLGERKKKRGRAQTSRGTLGGSISWWPPPPPPAPLPIIPPPRARPLKNDGQTNGNNVAPRALSGWGSLL